MELEKSKEILQMMIKSLKEYGISHAVTDEEQQAIETVLQALNDKDKQLQEISDEFLKYDWANSNSIQINNQLKSLHFSIFEKEKLEE